MSKKSLKKSEKFRKPNIPALNLPDDEELLKDFTQEAQRHLVSARNSLLILENVPTDQESIDNIFKTVHTIKGLAEFLNLVDISDLSGALESLIDLMRREVIGIDAALAVIIRDGIALLQNLLELLHEQLDTGRPAKGPYPSIAEVLTAIQAKITDLPNPAKKSAVKKDVPLISEELDLSLCAALEKKIKAEGKNITVKSDDLSRILTALKLLNHDFKDAQNKLRERQRELIRERDIAFRQTQQARQEARIKGEYLAHMAHEIRTLISAIMGFTDLLRTANLNSKQLEHINTILLSGNMMLEIVNHILDYAKVEAGKLKLESVEFNLDRIIEDVFRVIRPRIQNKPIDFFFNIQESVPRNLIGDPTRLKQIFINLLDNSIKFTEKGEIGLEVALENESPSAGRPDPATLKFVVRDTGIGIPADRQEHIFESFTQASESTTRIYGGSGLGLSLCKSFVSTMGGQIKLDSNLGQGSRFTFILKFALPDKPDSPPENTHPEFAGSLVFIVDSHEASSRTLKALCDKFHIRVLTATRTAKQASEYLLKLAEEKKPLPAIIFIDTMLPQGEGFLLAKKIRQQERYRKIKLIAISSSVKTAGSPEFKEAGFDLFLAKPFISAEVAQILSQILDTSISAPAVLSPKLLSKTSLKGIKVLIAEDSLPNQELMRVLLETIGCSYAFAKNGQEAITMLKQEKYDICFMDMQMPVMSGFEAAQIIRQELKLKLPIVAVTAAEFQEEKDKCYELGMNDYLPKPFDLEQLQEKILKCVKV